MLRLETVASVPYGDRVLEDLKLVEFLSHAPWRKAGTYRHAWPHEYVLSRMDGQRELFEMVCARFRAGEGVAATFFGTRNKYLFSGDYRYWLTTYWDAVDLSDGKDYVLNRVRGGLAGRAAPTMTKSANKSS